MELAILAILALAMLIFFALTIKHNLKPSITVQFHETVEFKDGDLLVIEAGLTYSVIKRRN